MALFNARSRRCFWRPTSPRVGQTVTALIQTTAAKNNLYVHKSVVKQVACAVLSLQGLRTEL